ncbi:MAG TPA: pentapeptide repeat-containing protein, partial [Pyrinomonadaceae bacterium]|nr:pentapeptide repeat-containing protein [Pyrinomonadaceae bacterium]
MTPRECHMVFNGKYTFQSTNASGPQRYVTTTASQGLTYPTVSAGAATETERLITYQQPGGGLLIQTGNLFYFRAAEDVGWIIGDPSPAQAALFKVSDEGGGRASLQIYLPARQQWLPVRYTVNVLLPYLVFPLAGRPAPADAEALYDFNVRQLTPSVAQLQASKDGRGLDFRNVDLTGQDLSGVDFTDADFTDATLDGVNFGGATLTSATFIGASLRQTNLTGATLDGAHFVGTNLSTVVWGQGISARGADFTDCVAVGCRVGSTDPDTHADFTGAHFDGADFSLSDLSYALLREATMLRATFVGSVMQSVDFTSAQLGGVDKTAAANLAYAYLPLANFQKANLFGVSFAYATLYGASSSLTGAATIEQADFSNAYLEGIDFTGATLNGAKFNNACLVGVNFTGAD